jgi:hypothetical protein
MEMEQIVQAVYELEGSLILAPEPGGDAPEIAWGDAFFYYAPDGTVPQHEQPFATIVTKDYPDDTTSDLNGDGRWRVNIHVGSESFTELLGQPPRDALPADFGITDAVIPHPVYGALGWIAVVNPGAASSVTVLRLLSRAYLDARDRHDRRAAV